MVIKTLKTRIIDITRTKTSIRYSKENDRERLAKGSLQPISMLTRINLLQQQQQQQKTERRRERERKVEGEI